MKREPKWLSKEDVLVFHQSQIAEFGGADGVRDVGLLESALARARHAHAYEQRDLFGLAATYAHGLAKNHPFVDGNKRTAFVTATVFLGINGIRLGAPEPEVVVMMEGLAAGDVSLEMLASWFKKHGRRTRKGR